MLHASTQQLIRKLFELTEEGAIAWKEGEAGASVFETEGYIVEVKEDPPGVRLLRADGRELERADTADLLTAWPGGEETYATKVADMAHHAGRIARGAETAIAKILSSLSAPPKKAVEPEPEPAFLAFDLPSPRMPSPEGATAIAAVSANLDAQRAAPVDPPISHSLPEPAPVPPEAETAIDRVLAVQPTHQAQPVVVIDEPPAPPPVMASEPQPQPEPDPGAETPPILIEPEPVEAAAPEPEPEPEPVQAATPTPIPAPEPEPAPAVAQSEQQAPPPPAPAPKAGFGAIDGFSRARPAPAPAPQPEPSKVTSTGLLMRGFSARTHQTVEPLMARDFMQRAAPEPQPKPVPAPTPQSPAPAAEKPREPANGADIYKPWA